MFVSTKRQFVLQHWWEIQRYNAIHTSFTCHAHSIHSIGNGTAQGSHYQKLLIKLLTQNCLPAIERAIVQGR
jgi:hypothetical protein